MEAEHRIMFENDTMLIKLKTQYEFAKDLYFDYLLSLYGKFWINLLLKVKNNLIIKNYSNSLIYLNQIQSTKGSLIDTKAINKTNCNPKEIKETKESINNRKESKEIKETKETKDGLLEPLKDRLSKGSATGLETKKTSLGLLDNKTIWIKNTLKLNKTDLFEINDLIDFKAYIMYNIDKFYNNDKIITDKQLNKYKKKLDFDLNTNTKKAPWYNFINKVINIL